MERPADYKVTYIGLGVLAAGAVVTAVGAGVGFGLAGRNRLHITQGYAEELRMTPVKLVGLGVTPTTNGGATMGAMFSF